MRKSIATSVLLVLAGTTFAEDLPDGVGVDTPSGSVFTTEITANDSDDYVFRGYPGMVLSVSVKASKGTKTAPNLLTPSIEVLRPGGAVVSDDEGLTVTRSGPTATAKIKLDATGYWKVRVRGAGGTVGAYSVAVKYTGPSLPALPLASKSFAAAGSISTATDADEFPFQGYSGQSFSAKVTIPRTSALDPLVTLVRPDGSIAATGGQGTRDRSVTIAAPLNADGTWRIRILGEEADPAPPHNDATTGAYSLSAKLGKVTATGLVADVNRQYRLTIPAIGGANIGWKLSYTGAAPAFNSLFDPTGTPLSIPQASTPLTQMKSLRLDPKLPLGDYVLTFDAPAGAAPTKVGFTRTLVLPRGAPKRVAKLSKVEPIILLDGISPTAGGATTKVSVRVNDIVDPNVPTGDVALFLSHVPLEEVELLNATTVRGTIKTQMTLGTYDVVVFSTSGQPAARAGAFQIVPRPVVLDIDPAVGPDSGGFELTITGTNFRPGRMGIRLDTFPQPITPSFVDETTIRFNAPPRPAGPVSFGVEDKDTQLTDDLPLIKPNLEYSFEYVATAAISRLVPSLVPILGNEIITVQGANFAFDDKVFIETAPNSGVYDEILQPTFVTSKKHQFMAPPRPKGPYRVHVQNNLGQPNPPKTRILTYFSFAQLTTNLGSLSDQNDAWSTAIADYDKSDTQDLFLSRRGVPSAGTPEAESLTRVLRNNGNGQFTEVTAAVLPGVEKDDWRADRIWATDVNSDGFPDLILTTNALLVPGDSASHTRFLMNEAQNSSQNSPRVFRDRTIDMIAAPRTMKHYGAFGADSSEYIADNWRGLDMWVGDIDKGSAGPPEIVITHDELKDDSNNQTDVFASGVYCGNYCVTYSTFAYSYSFYWGGSRLFVWDKSAKNGQGRYKFEANFFPRKSGPVVPQALPGGGQIPACSPHYSSICNLVFTPFTGKRVAVGTLDGDTKPDVAVISDKVVQRRAKINDTLATTSSLQVGINKFNPADGAGITDVTAAIFSLPGDTKGDTVAIGQPGFPDGNSFGVIAMSKASPVGSGSVMRFLKFVPGLGAGSFEDISALALPPVDANDRLQASWMQFLDVDQDGDQDLALLASAPPGPLHPAFRILRNERVGTTVGNFARTFDPLFAALVTPNEHLEGDVLSIGDVSGDGLLDYMVSRATPVGSGTQTRIIKTDR